MMRKIGVRKIAKPGAAPPHVRVSRSHCIYVQKNLPVQKYKGCSKHKFIGMELLRVSVTFTKGSTECLLR